MVSLTDPAVADLRRLDGAPLAWALKNMLLLESDALAGEPLLGSLVGYRKLVVGNRDWRVIWRATTDERGTLTVEIAEVWAVGARSDGDVYAEMERRVASLGATPVRRSLEAIVGAREGSEGRRGHPCRRRALSTRALAGRATGPHRQLRLQRCRP